MSRKFKPLLAALAVSALTLTGCSSVEEQGEAAESTGSAGPTSAEAQAAHRWKRLDIGDLSTLKVLILGYGASGEETARLLRPFGTEVRGVARRARADDPDAYTLDDLPDLLPWADALVNLLPHTKATNKLVDAQVLAQLADGALYINAGRGPTYPTMPHIGARVPERAAATRPSASR